MRLQHILMLAVSLLLLTEYFSAGAHPFAQREDPYASLGLCLSDTAIMPTYTQLEGIYGELLKQGAGYYNSRNYLAASLYAFLATYTDLHPAEAYMLLGHSLLAATGDGTLLLAGDTRAIQVAEEDFKPFALFGRATTYENVFDNYEHALLDYSEAIALKPDYALAYFSRGWAQDALGNYEEAIADLEYAYRLDPNCTYDYVGRGYYLFTINDFQPALLYLNLAVEVDPGNIDAWVWRGFILDAMGEPERALEDLNYALTLDAEYANVYSALGNAYFSLQRYTEALENYQRYQELTGDYESEFLVDRIQQIRDTLESSE